MWRVHVLLKYLLLQDKDLYRPIVYNYSIKAYDKYNIIKPYNYQILDFLKIHAYMT